MVDTSGLDKFDRLQLAIVYRQKELHRVADILATSAHRLRMLGTAARVLLIILGAVTSAQASFGELLTGAAASSNLVFALIGLTVSVIAGIETAFRFERRGTELNSLAAQCHSLSRHTDSLWQRQMMLDEGDPRRDDGALDLIDVMDAKLSEVQDKAAAAGIDIAWRLRERKPPLPPVADEDDPHLTHEALPTDPRQTYAA